eukprot:6169821-Lingulodinium_polyedra.AAC.1
MLPVKGWREVVPSKVSGCKSARPSQGVATGKLGIGNGADKGDRADGADGADGRGPRPAAGR